MLACVCAALLDGEPSKYLPGYGQDAANDDNTEAFMVAMKSIQERK